MKAFFSKVFEYLKLSMAKKLRTTIDLNDLKGNK